MSAGLACALGVLVLTSRAARAQAEQPTGYRHSDLAVADPESVLIYAALLQRSSAGHGSNALLGAMAAMACVMLFVTVMALAGVLESCVGLLGRCPVPHDEPPRAGQGGPRAAKGGHRRSRLGEADSRSSDGTACLAVPRVQRGFYPARLYTEPPPEGECVFRLPAAALLRRGRGERHLPEAAGRLALRAAALGTEGWPLVVFVGTGHMPAATAGPALQDTPVAGPRSLELRGPDGSHYGVLDPQEGADLYVVSCGGRPMLSVEGAGGHLSVTSGEGVPLAELRGAEGEPLGEPPEATLEAPEKELRIFEGDADLVLVLITVLSVLLLESSCEA